MAELLPFHGLLPSVERASAVAAVPYDVVNTREAAGLAKGNPYSFLHVSRPEIDLEYGIDLHDEKVYRQAGEAFRRLCREVPLTVDAGKHLHLPRQTRYRRGCGEGARQDAAVQLHGGGRHPPHALADRRGDQRKALRTVPDRGAGVLYRGRPSPQRRSRTHRRRVRAEEPGPHRQRGLQLFSDRRISGRPAEDPALQPGGAHAEPPHAGDLPDADRRKIPDQSGRRR